jgi:hypothetical protein
LTRNVPTEEPLVELMALMVSRRQGQDPPDYV